MALDEYLRAEQANLQQVQQLPQFCILIPLIDQLYELSVKLIPPQTSPFYGRIVLVCHKFFLSATSLIGRALPDDAAPVIRRAIEAARRAFAIKSDPENMEKWKAYEQRQKRWEARKEGRKPAKLRLSKSNLPMSHPILEELGRMQGVYSDIAVHFTPEYLILREWRQTNGRMFLNYFTSDQRELERAIILLTGTHEMILRLVDECVDRAFSGNETWARTFNKLITEGRKFSSQFGPPSGERQK